MGDKKIYALITFIFLCFFSIHLLHPFYIGDVWDTATYYMPGFGYVDKEVGFWEYVKIAYNSWTGRLFGDGYFIVLTHFASPLIFKILTAFINTLSIVLIITLPKIIINKNFSFSFFELLFGLIVYWFCAPVLAPVSWTPSHFGVYGFTIFTILLFYNIVFYLEKINFKNFLPFALSAFAAGCSNEGSAVVLVLFSLCLTVYHFIKKEKFFVFLYGFIFNLLGVILLLTAPGNFNRGKNQLIHFDIFDKLYDWLITGSPVWVFYQFGYLPIILIATLSLSLLNKVNKQSNFIFALIFVVLALCNTYVLIGSPVNVAGGRLSHSTFVYFVIALMFLFNNLELNKIQKYAISCFLGFGSVFYLFSFSQIAANTYQVKQQDKINNDLMKMAVKDKLEKITIPLFYQDKVIRNSDYIHTYNPVTTRMAKFYQYEKPVFTPRLFFNYSKMFNLEKTNIKLQQKAFDNLNFTKLNFYQTHYRAVAYKDNSLAIFFNKCLTDVRNEVLFIDLQIEGRKNIYKEASLNDMVCIKNFNFINIYLDRNLSHTSYKAITFGIKNKTQILSKFTQEIKL